MTDDDGLNHVLASAASETAGSVETAITDIREFIKNSVPAQDATNSNNELRIGPSRKLLSNDPDFPDHYSKYMTVSTVKLFDNRGIEMFMIKNSVGLYSILPQRRVQALATSARLRIVRLEEGFGDEFHPRAFLEVGDWVFPLTPNSPVLKTAKEYYIFPDLLSTTPGSSVGVVLPKSTPPKIRSKFEKILLQFLQLEEFPPRSRDYGSTWDVNLHTRTLNTENSTEIGESPPADSPGAGYGKRIGEGFRAGGELIAKGFHVSAESACQVMDLGTQKLKTVLVKEETDIPPALLDGIAYTRATTEQLVEISAVIMSKLAEITVNMAVLTAQYAKAAGSPYVEQFVRTHNLQTETTVVVVGEVQNVGSGLVGGAMEAYTGLTNAGVMLAAALTTNVNDVLEHCYGPAAAKILSEASGVVGNVSTVANNSATLQSPQKLAAKTAKAAVVKLAFDDSEPRHPSFSL